MEGLVVAVVLGFQLLEMVEQVILLQHPHLKVIMAEMV
jgi:hypothetical protein